MKPAPFDYVRPNSIEETCALLVADEDSPIVINATTRQADVERHPMVKRNPVVARDLPLLAKIGRGAG